MPQQPNLIFILFIITISLFLQQAFENVILLHRVKRREKYGIQCFSIYIFNPTMTGPLTAITNIMKGAFTAISNSMSRCMLSHLQGAGDTVKIKTITSEGLKTITMNRHMFPTFHVNKDLS